MLDAYRAQNTAMISRNTERLDGSIAVTSVDAGSPSASGRNISVRGGWPTTRRRAVDDRDLDGDTANLDAEALVDATIYAAAPPRHFDPAPRSYAPRQGGRQPVPRHPSTGERRAEVRDARVPEEMALGDTDHMPLGQVTLPG